jgi:predicted metal-dependent hydrolase
MIAMERSEIRWGTTQIPYQIRRSDRRGTVSVAVEPSGQIVLTAPATTTVERLDRVVRQKARWIVVRAEVFTLSP